MDVARTWTPRALATLAFALYALVAPAGLYWLDSAELTAAAAGMGSPHPTGFPLYCTVAKAASLVPVGELAYRLNLASAGCAALAVLWMTRLAQELGRDDLSGLIGAACAGATLAVSLVFMRQATVVEVYAPTAALMAGALVLVSRVARGGDGRAGLALALVCGLGLAMHVTFALVLPVVLVLLCWRLWRGARWPLVAPLAMALALGALLLYLPVRSATGRTVALDWGHPQTLANLAGHVTASRYRDAYGEVMRSTQPEVVWQNAAVLAESVGDSVGPMAPVFAVLGVIALVRARRSRWQAAALVLVLSGDVVFSAWIHPWGMEELQNTVPLSLTLCALAGVGLGALGRYLGRAGPYAASAFAVMLIVPPALGALSQVAPAASGDLPRAWAEEALAAMPPRAVALVQSDSTAATLLYVTAIEGERPDVAVLVRQHLHDGERTRAILARAGVAGLPEVTAGAWLDAVVALDRPVLWELGQDSVPAGTELVAGAPLSRLVRGAEERARLGQGDGRADIRGALASLSRLFAHDAHRDHAARRVHAAALTALGRLAYGRDDMELAELLFSTATAVRPEHVAAWVNRGVVAARARDAAAAAAHTERALALDPNRVAALVNAARYRIRQGDDARARRHLERALALEPDRADAWALAGLLELRAGRTDEALERIERALALDPVDPDALDTLRQLERKQLR